MCSTPFGIYGRNTAEGGIGGRCGLSCSTPFGIYGRNTVGVVGRLPWILRAQRLSASTEGTHREWMWSGTSMTCAQRLSASTEGTPVRVASDKRAADVLNAFRHLRKEHGEKLGQGTPDGLCSTPFGIYGRNTERSWGKERQTGCAQRLSASTEGTPRAPGARHGAGVFVLNAFRHLRKEHLVQGSGPYFLRWCAQRLSASTEGTLVVIAPLLSLVHQVLNAFRHLRKEHRAKHRGVPIAAMCSTPFGIYGRNTSGPAAARARAAMCSTPFGIYGRNTPAGTPP